MQTCYPHFAVVDMQDPVCIHKPVFQIPNSIWGFLNGSGGLCDPNNVSSIGKHLDLTRRVQKEERQRYRKKKEKTGQTEAGARYPDAGMNDWDQAKERIKIRKVESLTKRTSST